MAMSKQFQQQVQELQQFIVVSHKAGKGHKWELTDKSYGDVDSAIDVMHDNALQHPDEEIYFGIFDKDSNKVIMASKDGAMDALEKEMKKAVEPKKGKLAQAKEKVVKLSAKELKEKEQEEKAANFKLLPLSEGYNEDDVIEVPLKSLVKLEHTPIKKAKLAMRELNAQHVEALTIAYQKGDNLPPLDVQLSSMGAIVGNGYHRWAAMERVIRASIYGEDFENATKDPALEQEIENVREAAKVSVKLKNFNKHTDLINFAFQANLTNGLPMSKQSRSRYAIWLLERAIENNEKLSMREAAKIAGVTHGAVSRQIARDAAKENKMVDDFLPVKEDVELYEDDVEESEMKEEEDKLLSSSKRLFATIRTIVKLIDNPEQLGNYWKDIVNSQDENEVLVANKALAHLLRDFPTAATETEE